LSNRGRLISQIRAATNNRTTIVRNPTKSRCGFCRSDRRLFLGGWEWGCTGGIFPPPARSSKLVFHWANGTWRRIAFILFLAAAFLAETKSRPAGAVEAGTVRAANAHLQLGFDARGGGLRELVDLKAGHNHIGEPADELWEIRFVKAGNHALAVFEFSPFDVDPIEPVQA